MSLDLQLVPVGRAQRAVEAASGAVAEQARGRFPHFLIELAS